MKRTARSHSKSTQKRKFKNKIKQNKDYLKQLLTNLCNYTIMPHEDSTFTYDAKTKKLQARKPRQDGKVQLRKQD